MELLAAIAGIVALVFLVKNTKAQGGISQLRLVFGGKKNDL